MLFWCELYHHKQKKRARLGAARRARITITVQLSTSRYVYPDLTISYEPTDWQADTIYDPHVIIEALSPSTEAYDRGKKFAYYQQLASIQEYVLVNTQQQAIEVFTREGNAWHYQLYKAGEVAQLRSLTLSFAMVDVYAHVPTDDDKI